MLSEKYPELEFNSFEEDKTYLLAELKAIEAGERTMYTFEEAEKRIADFLKSTLNGN